MLAARDGDARSADLSAIQIQNIIHQRRGGFKLRVAISGRSKEKIVGVGAFLVIATPSIPGTKGHHASRSSGIKKKKKKNKVSTTTRKKPTQVQHSAPIVQINK